jgi:hypothetical protein
VLRQESAVADPPDGGYGWIYAIAASVVNAHPGASTLHAFFFGITPGLLIYTTPPKSIQI